MSKLDRLKNKTGKSDNKPAPDHVAITTGQPFYGPNEDPCPGPVPAREWHPEPHETYPNGPWEAVNFATGDVDKFGGFLRCWVHEEYKRRCHIRRYQRRPSDGAKAQFDDDYNQRVADAYGTEDEQ